MTFVPRVIATGKKPSAAMMAWAQAKADAAYNDVRLGEEGLETTAVEICAAKGPVRRHRDADGKEHMDIDGMRIIGLVLRSDSHVLHSDALSASGRPEGLPLHAGDLYEIDVGDPHWTTTSGAHDAQIIFSVNIMHPDGRNAKKLAHDIWWTVLAASIDDMRAAAA